MVPVVSKLLTSRFPARDEEIGVTMPRYLNPSVVDQPCIALGLAAREIVHMADIVEEMLVKAMSAFEDGTNAEIDQLKGLDNDIDLLHEQIKLYLTKVSRNPLSYEEGTRCVSLISFNTNLEHIGDIIPPKLAGNSPKKIRAHYSFSDSGWHELKDLHSHVVNQLRGSILRFANGGAH